jgi:hypothetical protein
MAYAVALRESGDFCYLARLHEWMEEYEAGAVLTEAQSLYPEYWEIRFSGQHSASGQEITVAPSIPPSRPRN